MWWPFVELVCGGDPYIMVIFGDTLCYSSVCQTGGSDALVSLGPVITLYVFHLGEDNSIVFDPKE